MSRPDLVPDALSLMAPVRERLILLLDMLPAIYGASSAVMEAIKEDIEMVLTTVRLGIKEAQFLFIYYLYQKGMNPMNR